MVNKVEKALYKVETKRNRNAGREDRKRKMGSYRRKRISIPIGTDE